jgi:hypothetical protein
VVACDCHSTVASSHSVAFLRIDDRWSPPNGRRWLVTLVKPFSSHSVMCLSRLMVKLGALGHHICESGLGLWSQKE